MQAAKARPRPAGKRGGAPQRGRRVKHRRTLFDSDDDSEEGDAPRAPRNPHLLAGEQAPGRGVARGREAVPGPGGTRRFPWKSAPSGLWGGTGAQTQRAAIYTFARAGVVSGSARLAAVPSPSHLLAPPPPCVCLFVCFCAVCALHGCLHGTGGCASCRDGK